MTELKAGDQVGEYRIEGPLGEGGFGSVYKAVHPLIGKRAAIKVLHLEFSAQPEIVSRFVDEARAVNQIRHRGIIDIFSFGALADGRHYYVMELLEGATLHAYLEQRGALPIAEALPILRDIARAIDAAHATGIAHRDLKPENVFLVFDDAGVSVKILDFGIAKLLGEKPAGSKTRTGTAMGTPCYMSPEQTRGVNVDRRTDVYAFGVMTFELLTGKLPFDADTAIDLMVKHMHEPPPAPSSVSPGVGTALDEPILKMLAKNAEDRPPSLVAAIEAVARAAGMTMQSAASLPRSAQGAPELAHAKTVSSGGSSLLASSAEIAPPRRRIWPLVAIATVLALAGVAGAPSFFPRGATSTSATSAQAIATPPAHSSAPAALQPPVSAPKKTALVVDSVPPHVQIFSGAEELGTAPGPIELPAGPPVKLTVKAPGYVAMDVEVDPSHETSIHVTLTPVPASTAPKDGVKKKAYEDPFK